MDISADVDRIIDQAPDWNLAGDCALLALMKRISENLYERGERTSRNLQEFETSVRQVDISLSNATNSLRSLQFGHQFVEYRVEEVDDADLAMPEEKKKKVEPPPMSTEEMARGFLDNNLRMFRKNFEPVTIDVPDSDDEDAPVSSTTVFRAKNPYDAIPLPYIIGTKEWEEHKYAGLYDSGENSGDDKSDEFSSSSSDEKESVSKGSKQPENKFVEPQLSDSSSLASFAREPAIVSPVKTPKPVIMPPAGQVPEAAIRTQPRPIISSQQRNPHERDMFAALRQSPPSDDPPSTSSSPTSSPAFRKTSSGGRLPIVSTASLSSSSSSPAHQAPPRLFEDKEATQPPPKDIEAKPSQIKRKPVNLFNDDEFNSFMSEIVGKVQAKAGAAETNAVKEPPKEKKPMEQPTKQAAPAERINPAVLPQAVPRRVNLFDDSPPLSPSSKVESLLKNTPSLGAIPKQTPPKEVKVDRPSASQPPKQPAKSLPKSLFDDDLEDDDFLSSLAPKSKPVDQKPSSKPKTSLFDDDDLDINDIFTKPTATNTNKLSARVSGKTSLFDDDDDQEDDADLFGSKKPIKVTQKEQSTVKSKVEPPEAPKKSLFDDIEEEDLFGTPKATARYKEVATEVGIKEQRKHIEIEPKKLSKPEITEQQHQLFSNRSSSPAFRESPPPIESLETTHAEREKEKNSNDGAKASTKLPDFFLEDCSDEDPFLESLNARTKPKGASETNEFMKPIVKGNEQIKEQDKLTSETVVKSSGKLTDLFNEDSSDEDRFLSASSKAKDVPLAKPETKEVIKPNKEQFKEDIKPNKDQFKEEIKPIKDQFKEEIKPNKEQLEEVIKPNEDQFVEEIKPKELPHKLSEEVLPEKKLDDELTVKENASAPPETLNNPEMVVPVSETPPPDDYQSNQDPIITMVADITNKSPQDDSTKRKPADLAAAQQIMQNYSSLFSDEPPDDSEFFQTLGSSSSGLSSLSASKIFDNEHDFFEPSLPKIPSATKSSGTTPGEQPPADYGGMRLFSDVPPEDEDDIDEHGSAAAAKQPEDVAPATTTTRIHTIFYDDFSETARAGSMQPSPKTSPDKEEPPPPGDEPDRSKAKESSSPVKKLKMPNIKINVQALLPGSGGGVPKLLKKKESSSFEESLQGETSSVSLQKPTDTTPAEGSLQHVNKTRARGPAKRRPSTRRGRQENYVKSLIADEQEPSQPDEAKLLSSTKSVAVEKVNPSTVLAPSQKISPPKAMDSFLDSPDDDDSLFGSFTTKTVPSATPIEGKMSVTATPVSAVLMPSKPPEDRRQSVIPRKNNDPPASYRSFLDSPDEDDFLFSSADKKETPPIPKNSSAVKELAPPKVTPQVQREAPKVASSFLDSSDDDDFLFSSPKATKSTVPAIEKPRDADRVMPSMLPRTQEPPKEQIKPKSQAVPKLFDDSDDDDDLFASAAVPAPAASVSSSSRPVQAKQQAKPAASSLFSSDEDAAKAAENTLPKKKLAIKTTKSLFSDDDDDDDDLFGGGSMRKASAVKKTKPIARTISKPAPSKTPTVTATTIPDSISDNPLADLLDVE